MKGRGAHKEGTGRRKLGRQPPTDVVLGLRRRPASGKAAAVRYITAREQLALACAGGDEEVTRIAPRKQRVVRLTSCIVPAPLSLEKPQKCFSVPLCHVITLKV